MKKQKSLKILFFIFSITFPAYGLNFEKGRSLFNSNCTACHQNGANLIIPEKNLKKEILQDNGMYSINAIKYQVLNGKNGMPAFGGRLKEQEIEEIANYVIITSEKNFEL
jgi:cytochrome c6